MKEKGMRKMKNLKKGLSKLSALLMVAVLICAMLPVQADAVAFGLEVLA